MPLDRTTAWFRSLNFGERNGYLKGPARFRSLDFGQHNGYLKGPARFCSLDFGEVQLVPQGHRTHRCSAEEHGAPDLLMQSRQLLGRGAATKVWSPWSEEISSNFMNWPT